MEQIARDYSIIGPEKERAREKGLIDAEWYISPIPRHRLKELMKRKDGPAIRDTFIWLAALIISGYAAYLSWGTWWAVPAFLLYGTLYMTPAVAKWHEFSHGTAFKTSWMNEVMYQVCSFMIMVQATNYRWSHARHHTDTIIVGSDPEINTPRPPVWSKLIIDFFRLKSGPRVLKTQILHCFGHLNEVEKELIPESEYRKLFWESRIYMLTLFSIVVLCIYTGSLLPAMFVGLTLFYGSYLTLLLVFTQHLGLNEDVLDHRLNTRTFYTNPILRFLYSNMNYHMEHHMFPMVPYHALPALHEEIKHDCPPANPSFRTALKEVVVALWRQRKDPSYTINRPLPDSASPFKYDPNSVDE